MPVPVGVMYVPSRYATDVQFEDGGVWRLPDRALLSIDRDDVQANIGEIFARWPERFHFIERLPARYARRK